MTLADRKIGYDEIGDSDILSDESEKCSGALDQPCSSR